MSSFTASDNVAVTGYLVTTSATKPLASAAGWAAAAPTAVTAPSAGTVTFYAWAKDAAGNISAALSATVTITLPDAIAPTVSAFTLPATATSLTVPVSSFTATDNLGVTSYLVNNSATKPLASAAGWSATAPASVTAPNAGTVIFYAWAQDAAGNVSLSRSATVTITLPAETVAPTVSAFTLPATSTTLTVPVTSFTASDNVAVTGYLVNRSATKPLATTAGWSAVKPTRVTSPVAGTVTFYAWAKDAAGNVSDALSATVLIDNLAPTVSAFTLPVTATALTVPVTSFTATDNLGVTGYLVTTSYVKPLASAAGWSAAAPASVTAAGTGYVTFYAWARDAAGNVSLSRSARVKITLPPETVAPTVSAFTMPASSTSILVPVSSLTASDNVAVSGYLINRSATKPLATAPGWSAVKPTRVVSPVTGTVTFYAWAKDAAGNVSEALSATVNIDPLAPRISAFTLPATATALTVPVSSFTATDNLGVTGYLVNRSYLKPLASAAGWSAAAPTEVTAPAAGYVTFYAWVKDAAGNVSLSRSARVNITQPANTDTVKPVLTLSTLADDTVTNNPTLNVSGRATDNIGLKSVAVNGAIVPVASDGRFSTALTLNEGANAITVEAVDAAGNRTIANLSVTYQPLAPVLSIAVPADNLVTAQGILAVSGTTVAHSTITVSVNGKNPQVATISGNTFSASVYLTPGLNTVAIDAVDTTGNVCNAKRTVIYDNSNPTLAITEPGEDKTTGDPALTLKGKVADSLSDVTVTVAMDGKSFTPAVNDSGSFEQKLTFTTAKQYTIVVTATDAAGNKVSTSRNVIYKED
ncbi:MAG: hypothetical protein FDZ69_12595 [Deltaproteobacteria bacterium]|nr:MAG: hypothetical protein FDZ69_12595 [Deltaproteobacteria bacterium]